MISARELAQESTKVQISTIEYDELTQTRFQSHESSSALTVTFNSTQTFDINGKPWDADNDR